ncbi:hypothetical protein FIBSPDRAFT_877884 [Athelia psychrophila]|uniref:Uncharacterized protein n=1 Tax=Athelia psychrophila TaxID=1759441 RepID=A0A167VKK7_9AGAM|nr:hypothetical protein FIBSPDRAFT_877884 [Fibularhizoctonia sp. CBS 109695]
MPATPRSKWAEKILIKRRIASAENRHHAEDGDDNENLDDDFEDNDPEPPRLYLYLARPMRGQVANLTALAC